MTSIPFLASGNYGTNADYSTREINNKIITGLGDSYTYFGYYLNIYGADNTIT